MTTVYLTRPHHQWKKKVMGSLVFVVPEHFWLGNPWKKEHRSGVCLPSMIRIFHPQEHKWQSEGWGIGGVHLHGVTKRWCVREVTIRYKYPLCLMTLRNSLAPPCFLFVYQKSQVEETCLLLFFSSSSDSLKRERESWRMIRVSPHFFFGALLGNKVNAFFFHLYHPKEKCQGG